MTLTQILQKIKSIFYTKSQIDSMGGGTSLDTTIRSKQNALSTAQLSAVNSGITSNKVSQYDEYINGASGQPVGTISWVMGSTVPAGYLICNGSAVSRTAYDKLFQAIGTKYGEGDGSTTFNLPNLIDRFLQGGETSGTIKDAGLPNITGHIEIGRRNRANYTDGAFAEDGTVGGFAPSVDIDSGWYSFNASRSSSIYGNSTTVQPPAITSIPCIKAFDSVIDATTVSVAQLSDTKVNKAGDTMTGSLTAPSFITNGIDCSVDSQGDGWIRYSNGLQICWGSVPVAIGTSLDYDPPSTMYYRRTGCFNYAKGFSSIPVVSVCVFTSNAHPFLQVCVESSADNTDRKLTTGSIMLSCKYSLGTIRHETSIQIQAIGRWK